MIDLSVWCRMPLGSIHARAQGRAPHTAKKKKKKKKKKTENGDYHVNPGERSRAVRSGGRTGRVIRLSLSID
jgi:hypothetical protein